LGFSNGFAAFLGIITGRAGRSIHLGAASDNAKAQNTFAGSTTGNARDVDLTMWIENDNYGGNPRLIVPKFIIIGAKSTPATDFAAFNMKLLTGGDNKVIGRASYQSETSTFVANKQYGRIDAYIRSWINGATYGEFEIMVEHAGIAEIVARLGNLRNFGEFKFKSLVADPAVADLTDGYMGIFKNTTSGNIWLAVNDGAVIKKVQLV